jgi:hypothetical protein
MGDNSKPSGQSVSIENRDPWKGVQPYLQAGFADAEVLKNNPIQYYPNSTVVPLHGATHEALGGIADRARAGSDVLRAGQTQTGMTAAGGYEGASPAAAGYGRFAAGTGGPGQAHLANVAGGGYMGRNKYLDDIIKRATDTAGANIDARFTKSGAYGSGHHAKAISDTSADIAANVLGSDYAAERARMDAAAGGLTASQLSGLAGAGADYGAERDRMLRAAGMTEGMAAADYSDLQALGGVGAAFEKQGAATLEDQIKRYMHAQTAPRDALKDYMTAIQGGNYGGTSTSTAPIYSDPWATALGYGTGAAGIATSLFGKDGIWGK